MGLCCRVLGPHLNKCGPHLLEERVQRVQQRHAAPTYWVCKNAEMMVLAVQTSSKHSGKELCTLQQQDFDTSQLYADLVMPRCSR